MKLYFRIIFFVFIALALKVMFNVVYLPVKINSLKKALKYRYLIKDDQNLVINMKKVLKTPNPKQVFDQLLEWGGDINAKKIYM